MCILQTDSFTSWAPVSICYTILSQDGLSVFGSELDLFGNTGPEVAIQKFVYEGDADSLGSKTMGKCRRKQKLPVSNGIMCQKMGYFYSKLKLPPASGVFTPWPPQGGGLLLDHIFGLVRPPNLHLQAVLFLAIAISGLFRICFHIKTC